MKFPFFLTSFPSWSHPDIHLWIPSIYQYFPHSYFQTVLFSEFLSHMFNCLGMCSFDQSYLTLCDTMHSSLTGSFVHGIFQAKILTWVAISLSRGSSRPRSQNFISCTGRQILCHCERGNRTGSILKARLHLGPDCGLWAICPVSMEMMYKLQNQAPGRKRPRALCCLKEYRNYLCNRIE